MIFRYIKVSYKQTYLRKYDNMIFGDDEVMTKEGYKTVLVREEDYEKIREIARNEDISIVKAISKILREYMNATVQHQT